MNRTNIALFTTLPLFALACFGCATATTRPEPADIPTLGQIATANATLPADQALETAKRLVLNTKFAHRNEACVVSAAEDADPETGRNRSLATASRLLTLAFTGGNAEELAKLPKRTVWWLSADNMTYYTLLCVIIPATPAAQTAFASLPGNRESMTPGPESEAAIAKAETPAAIAAPAPAPTIWDEEAKHEAGASFAYRDLLCSFGRAEIRKNGLDEAKEASSFLAASNILYALEHQFGDKTYGGDAEDLLNAAGKEWRQPSKRVVEAAVCIALPAGARAGKSLAAN